MMVGFTTPSFSDCLLNFSDKRSFIAVFCIRFKVKSYKLISWQNFETIFWLIFDFCNITAMSAPFSFVCLSFAALLLWFEFFIRHNLKRRKLHANDCLCNMYSHILVMRIQQWTALATQAHAFALRCEEGLFFVYLIVVSFSGVCVCLVCVSLCYTKSKWETITLRVSE